MRPGIGSRTGRLLALGCGLAVAGLAVVYASVRIPVSLGAFRRGAHALVERTRAVEQQARTFDQHEVLAALAPNARNGEYYRFDERLADARVGRDGDPWRPQTRADLPLAIEYDDGDDVRFVPRRSQYTVEDGVLRMTYRDRDYMVLSAARELARAAISQIEIRLKVRDGTSLQLVWSEFPLEKWRRLKDHHLKYGTIRVETIPDGTFHSYVIDAENALRYRVGSTIKALFLQPSDAAGDEVEIDSIRFLPKRQKYGAAPAGWTYEMLGGEMRSSIYADTPLRLTYTVAVPAERPQLTFGMGVLDDARPVEFRVTVAAGDGPPTLVHRETVRDAAAWRDARVDVSRWAGRRVDITFETAGEGVAFWSNPMLFGPPRERFNVLLVLEDTLRADRLSAYGHERPTSPVKERLAAGGILFEHAFSQTTQTRPSCPSMMTSLYPTATGVWNFQQMLDERYLTMAEVLRSQGFVTGALLQNPNAGPAAGLHQGFSTVADSGSTAEGLYGTDAIRWLERHGDRNFFLYLHVLDPHGVYEPGPPFDAWYREASNGRAAEPDRQRMDPPWVEQPTVEGRRLLYDGEIRQNDHHFGRFLEHLEAMGLREDTVILFVSDHGEHLGERQWWRHHPPAFIQVVRIPLIVSYPRGLTRPRTVRHPVQLMDVMPTVLELAGIDARALPMQGDSLVPLLQGQDGAYWAERVTLAEEVTRYKAVDDPNVWSSVFFQGWHFLESELVPDMQIFNYERDPQEREGRVPGFWDHLLRRAVLDLMAAVKNGDLAIWRAITRGESRAIRHSPEVHERLRQLGYVE
jgi:arylsulfatase A-like enzyme